ncbi:hypothetical protein Ancab_012704 [Ancistrocladus abbreviatus]
MVELLPDEIDLRVAEHVLNMESSNLQDTKETPLLKQVLYLFSYFSNRKQPSCGHISGISFGDGEASRNSSLLGSFVSSAVSMESANYQEKPADNAGAKPACQWIIADDRMKLE